MAILFRFFLAKRKNVLISDVLAYVSVRHTQIRLKIDGKTEKVSLFYINNCILHWSSCLLLLFVCVYFCFLLIHESYERLISVREIM